MITRILAVIAFALPLIAPGPLLACEGKGATPAGAAPEASAGVAPVDETAAVGPVTEEAVAEAPTEAAAPAPVAEEPAPAPSEEREVARDPKKGEEIYLQGLRARAADDMEGAITLFEQAGRLGFSRGWKDAATTNHRLGRLDAAIAACDAYLRDDPKGEYAKTVTYLRDAIKRQKAQQP